MPGNPDDLVFELLMDLVRGVPVAYNTEGGDRIGYLTKNRVKEIMRRAGYNETQVADVDTWEGLARAFDELKDGELEDPE